MLLLGAATFAACSTLPPHEYPSYADHDVIAEYVVPADGRLPMPSSRRDLVVRELLASPDPLGERLGRGGERWWLFPGGAHVRLHCRFRIYAAPNGVVPAPETVLPGAIALHDVEAP